ncbi:MAG: hypothetical protein U5N53_09535 [Mycobacterium sp.]|nr:hypothetical protein [Mycobacterium sp.]
MTAQSAHPCRRRNRPLRRVRHTSFNAVERHSAPIWLARRRCRICGPDEAARYFYLAAQNDWDNPVLVERAFIAFAADGQIGQAASTAKHLLDLDRANELAELVVATRSAQGAAPCAAAAMLGAIGQESFTGITASILQQDGRRSATTARPKPIRSWKRWRIRASKISGVPSCPDGRGAAGEAEEFIALAGQAV